jgi:hypothetical protein
MGKSATTHVIEIETGIGEPAFIPLTLGQELQPISLGRKGMWKIESARVLDVHAFVYFDGTALFLQSADESAAAAVDGYAVGKAWTELHAPCKIELGAARLRYRSLLPDQQETEALERPAVKPPGAPGHPSSFPKADRPFRPGEFSAPAAAEESTRVVENRPVPPGQGGRGGPGPSHGDPDGPQGGYPAHGGHPPPSHDAHVGQYMQAPPSARGGVPAGPRPAPMTMQTMQSLQHPGSQGPMIEVRPQAGRQPEGQMIEVRSSGRPPEGPYLDDRGARMDLTASTNRHRQVTGPHMMDPRYPDDRMGHTPVQPVFVPPMHGAHGPMQGLQPIPSGMTPMGPNSGAYHPYPGHGTNPTGPPAPARHSGPYSAPPGMPGGYGSMTGGQVGGQPEGGGDWAQRYRELSAPKRILVILAPFCLVAAAYLVLFDSPPGQTQATNADAGAEAAPNYATTTPPLAQPVQVQPGVPGQPIPGQPIPGQPIPGQPIPGQPLPALPTEPQPVANGCPPGYVPYTIPLPNGAIPCVLLGTPMPPPVVPPPLQTPPPTPPPPPTGTPAAPKDAGPPPESSLASRTLERQAVDYVAMNDYIHAAQVYEQLQAQNPSNRVYAEAARILRAKADAGAPP